MKVFHMNDMYMNKHDQTETAIHIENEQVRG